MEEDFVASEEPERTLVIDDNDDDDEEDEEEKEEEKEEKKKKKKKNNMLWPATFLPCCRKKFVPLYSHCPDEVSSRIHQNVVGPTAHRPSNCEDCNDTGT